MRILIGGMGDIGTSLAVKRVEHGDRVWGIRRHYMHPPPPGIIPIEADLRAADLCAHLPEEIDLAVYTAGPRGARTEDAYRGIYVDGLRSFLSACEAMKRPPNRVFFASSTAVYGDHGGDWVNEKTEAQPSGASGRILLEAERCLSASHLPTTTIRLAGIYGPDRTRLIDRVTLGDAKLETEERYTNRIHRADCVGIFEHLIDTPDLGPLYLAVDDEPVPYNDVITYLAGLTKAPDPERSSTPPSVHPIRGRSNKRCSNARLRSCGYRLLFPDFRVGYSHLVQNRRAKK
jgi:nucleoside-diphosphate-sugar epimerase